MDNYGEYPDRYCFFGGARGGGGTTPRPSPGPFILSCHVVPVVEGGGGGGGGGGGAFFATNFKTSPDLGHLHVEFRFLGHIGVLYIRE